MYDADLLVIGGGPAGYAAALKAAELKKQVVLFESDNCGGTCLNKGCIPTKALLKASGAYGNIKNLEELGVFAQNPSYDMDKMHQHVSGVVTTLRQGIDGLLSRAKVNVVNERAIITGANTVSANGKEYSAQNILIATGSVPLMPPIDGINSGAVHSSDYFLQNAIDLKSLIIVGGGVIGVEFAQIYSDLGCEVTIIEGKNRLLPLLEREVGQSVAMSFKKRGIEIITSANVTKIKSDENDVLCTYSVNDQNYTKSAQKILMCVGRKPNTDNLINGDIDLLMQRGFIPVNENYETKVKGIYAAGDVVLGSTQLAHAAHAQAVNAVCAMFEHHVEKNTNTIPACIFTNPEIATAGMNADEAKEKGIEVRTVKNLTTANGRCMVEGAGRGFVKLVADAKTDRLLGATLMCPHAGEMIGTLVTAINEGLTLTQLQSSVYCHPTISEIIAP